MSPLAEAVSNYSRFGFFNANHFMTDAVVFSTLNRKSAQVAFLR